MGYEKEVFTDESSILSRAHDAHCAVTFLYSASKQEREKAEQLVEPEHSRCLQRSAILDIAYKLAQKRRDDLLKDLAFTIGMTNG